MGIDGCDYSTDEFTEFWYNAYCDECGKDFDEDE